MNRSSLFENSYVNFAIRLKTNQLQRESLPSLTYQQVLKTLDEGVWKHSLSLAINQAVSDIMNLEVSTIVSFLANDAIIKGSKMNLDDMGEILKGDFYE